MTTRMIVGLLLLSGPVAGTAAPAPMSDPIGLYALVEKVVLEPSETSPERIQVWGAFALADSQNADDYAAPQTGYLYYRCAPNQETTCRKEWTDLKSVAGKGTAVGFGGRYTPTGRVRKAADKPSEPDVYPIRMGVVRMGPGRGQPAIVTALKAALAGSLK
jgi:hypothetical protein